MANVCLPGVSINLFAPDRDAFECVTHVYLSMLESLLQILIDCLVGYLAYQRKIGHSDFLLLGRF